MCAKEEQISVVKNQDRMAMSFPKDSHLTETILCYINAHFNQPLWFASNNRD